MKEFFSRYRLPLAVIAMLLPFPLASLSVLLTGGGPNKLCPIRTISGYDCPLCGLTRAFDAVCHGNLAEAAAFNPFWGLFAMLVSFIIFAWVFGSWRQSGMLKRSLNMLRTHPFIILVILAFMTMIRYALET